MLDMSGPALTRGEVSLFFFFFGIWVKATERRGEKNEETRIRKMDERMLVISFSLKTDRLRA